MKKTIFIFCIFFGFSTSVLTQTIEGKYFFTQDSDNKKAKANSTIYIQFSKGGKFSFKGMMPGTTIEDKGTYKLNGSDITISFEEMEQGTSSGMYSLQDGTLVLPFKMLSSSKGSSTWQKEGTVAKNNQIDQLGATAVIDRLINNYQQNLSSWVSAIDNKVQVNNSLSNAELAVAYYQQAILFRIEGQIFEAIYCMAKAANLQLDNGLYQNNLAELLLEVDKLGDALTILTDLSKKFPKLASVFSNLSICYTNTKDYSTALDNINKALKLQPTCGTYLYNKGCILENMGDLKNADIQFEQAFKEGSAKAGRKIKSNDNQSKPDNKQSVSKNVQAAKNQKSKNNTLTKQEKLKIWEGSYEAAYLSARSGENEQEKNTKFGDGMATTILSLQTLACVKSFNMNINSVGGVSGNAEILYVYQGKVNGPVASLVGAPLAAITGGFGAVLKDGFQTRNWTFSGEVNENGEVEIEGLPTEKLDLFNVGKWQKITPWSPIKPDAAGAAMKGPFHFKITEGENGKNFAAVDDYVELNDNLIKRVHYRMLLIKTNDEIIPDCKMLEKEPPKAKKCPASEYIKTKVSVSSSFEKKFSITTTKSNTYTKGASGTVEEKNSTSVSSSIKLEPKDYIPKSFMPGLLQVLSLPIQFKLNPDLSYEFSVGVGVSSDKILKDVPYGFNESLNIIYDSKCGMGVKGSVGAKYKKGDAANAEVAVEGVIFFNKSL